MKYFFGSLTVKRWINLRYISQQGNLNSSKDNLHTLGPGNSGNLDGHFVMMVWLWEREGF